MYEEHDETYSYRREFPSGWCVSQAQKETWSDGAWQINERIEFTYDGNGTITESFWDSQGNGWSINHKMVYGFDPHGNLITELGPSGGEYMKSEYSYDSVGNETGLQIQLWRDSLWMDDSRSLFAYNGHGKITRWLTHSFHNQWLDSLQYVYSYDEHGNALQKLEQSSCAKLDSGKWRNSEKYTYKNDSVGHRTEELYESWKTDAWIPHWKREMRYDSNGRIIDNVLKWLKKDLWVNDTRRTYTYDVHGNVTELHYSWNDDNWDISGRKIFTYGEDAIMSQVLTQRFKDNVWINSSRVVYTWQKMDNI